MKKNLLLFLITLQIAYAQSINNVSQAENFIYTPNMPFDSTATADDITSIYFNPAGIGIHPLQIGYFYGKNKQENLNDHLLFLSIFGLAFSSQWRYIPDGFNAKKFTAGTGIETGNVLSIGTSYSWYKSDSALLDNYSEWDMGAIFRPSRYVSLGSVARGINSPIFQDRRVKPRFDVGISLRPFYFSPENLTLSYDITIYQNNLLKTYIPRYSAEIIPFSGFTLYGGSIELKDYFFGIKYSQNITQLSYQNRISQNKNSFYNIGLLVSQERFKTRIEGLQRFLHISIDTPFSESKKGGIFFSQNRPSFYDLLAALKQAETDPQISGVVITGRSFSGGWAQAEELRNSLLHFKTATKKPVYTYYESASDIEYYIATASDSIMMPPAAVLEINGLNMEVYFWNGLLKKLGVQADFLKIGNFKSAPNTYTNEKPDSYEVKQMNEIISSLLSELKRAILTKRPNLTEEKLDELMNKGLFSADVALQQNLIEEIGYYDEFVKKINISRITSYGWEIDLNSYLKTKIYDDTWGLKPAIAVLVLDGEIVSAQKNKSIFSDKESIAFDSVSSIIKGIRENPRIKGVVLRIDSPGGSTIASDLIWNEINNLRKEKPVIISMGNYAASGGYYISTAAEELVSDATTITGSIGVFSGKFSFEELYKKLGVHKEIYNTHRNGSIYSESKSYDESEKTIIMEQMNSFYKIFLEKVQKNRTALSEASVEENAEGRVFTGSDAKKKGMVDRIGGVMLAIEIARQKAGISENAPFDTLLYSDESESLLNLGKLPLFDLPISIKKSIELLTGDTGNTDNEFYFVLPFTLEIH